MENFRFFDLKVYTLADPQVAIAEVKAEALIKPKRRIALADPCDGGLAPHTARLGIPGTPTVYTIPTRTVAIEQWNPETRYSVAELEAWARST